MERDGRVNDEYREMRIGDVTVRIDRATCIGSKNCVQLAPEVFELDEQNIVTFREGAAASGIERERLVEACAICPVDALSAFDADGSRVV